MGYQVFREFTTQLASALTQVWPPMLLRIRRYGTQLSL